MLKTKEILDEKDKRLRLVSKEVSFPLTQKDKDLINTMIEYLRNSQIDRKSTRLNSSHVAISYAVFCLKKKKK